MGGSFRIGTAPGYLGLTGGPPGSRTVSAPPAHQWRRRDANVQLERRARADSMTGSALLRVLTEALAVDLGTTNTRIYSPGRGVVLNEPSAVALHRYTGQVVAVGSEAYGLFGREPLDVAVHLPIRAGAIENVDAAERMLEAFVRLACAGRFRRRRLVVGVPGSSTPLEQRAVRNAAVDARAAHVDLVDSGLAAALGANVADDEQAHLVVDIGGGTTDVAVVVGPYVVASSSVKVGGDLIDAAIQDYVHGEFGMLLGERAAEHLKRAAGAAVEPGDAATHKIVGKRLTDGFPKAVNVSAEAVHEAIRPVLHRMTEATRLVVERLTPDTIADIYDTGITLTGGGALLRGLEDYFHESLDLAVQVSNEPATAAVVGAGRLLAHPAALDRVAMRESVWLWRTAEGFAISA